MGRTARPGDSARRLRVADETTLTEEEVYRVVELAPTAFAQALVAFTFDTAARATEVCRVRLCDLDFRDDGRILVTVPANKAVERERRVWLRCAAPYLHRWLRNHPDRDNSVSLLFPSFVHGTIRPMNETLLYGHVKRAAKRAAKWAKLSKPLSPRLLRHARLTQWAKMGVSRTQLKLLAGWAPNSQRAGAYPQMTTTTEPVVAFDEMEPPKQPVRPDCRNCLNLVTPAFVFCPVCGERQRGYDENYDPEKFQPLVRRRADESRH